MRKTAPWSLHRADLPLRLATETEANGRFRYVIIRNDGTVAQTSSATLATEAEARAAGGPVHRGRSLHRARGERAIAGHDRNLMAFSTSA